MMKPDRPDSPRPSGAYVPTSADEQDYVNIDGCAACTTLSMSDAEKRSAGRRKAERDRAGGFGFGKGAK